jgi:hypothetical protein
MRLSSAVKELGPGETEVTAVSQVNITGIMAQMGRGMIQDVSDQLFGVFSQRMRAELESAATASAAAAPASSEAPKDTPAQAAAVVTPAPPDPKPAPSAPAPVPEVLDLGPIGARAAKRATARLVSTPGFWLGALAVVVVVYLILR